MKDLKFLKIMLCLALFFPFFANSESLRLHDSLIKTSGLCSGVKTSEFYISASAEKKAAIERLIAKYCDLESLQAAGIVRTEQERLQYRWAQIFNSIEGDQTECAQSSDHSVTNICRYSGDRYELSKFNDAVECKKICFNEIPEENQVVYTLSPESQKQLDID